MKYHQVHSFPVTPDRMEELQNDLRKQIEIISYPHTPKIVCGIDLAYFQDRAVAVLVAMDHKSKEIIEIVHHLDIVLEPYVPGFLAYRELPLILQAWEKLTVEPDVVFFDGNGMLHPRRMGIATHAAFFLQKPTIGIAKTYLLGTYDVVEDQQGAYQLILDKNEQIGAVVRTQTRVKPVYVSVGNRIRLEDAIRLSLEQVATESRIPEVVRQADIWTRKLRKQYME